MPYMLVGKCVHKKNADGTPGEQVGCSDTEEEARAHMQALMANVEDAHMGMEAATPQDIAKTTIFTEVMEFDLAEAKIDAEARTVTQVLIRPGLSKNSRRCFYSEDVLQSAAPLFEGVQTYANHPTPAELKQRPERDMGDLTGWIDNVIYEGGALRGTRHFFRTQRGNDSWAIVEDIIAGRAPASILGASINAVGKGKPGKGEQGETITLVHSIDKVFSVDDVTAAAAGGGFERLVASDGGDGMMKALFSALDYQEYLEARPDYVERLKREHKFVRLGDATKTAMAESDQKVKAATTKLAQNEEALLEAQAQLETLTEVNARLASEVETLRRELAVTEVLKRVHLAESYKNDLRERLPMLPESEWDAIIAKEAAKAKAAGVTPRVAVSGAGQQVQRPQGAPVSPVPLPDEDVETWQKRMASQQQRK